LINVKLLSFSIVEQCMENKTKQNDKNALDYDHLLKIIIVGDTCVGKSSLLVQWADNYFLDTNISTIGVDFKIKTIHYGGKTLKLQVWDTAGQERFKSIVTSYYRGADGIMYVFDLTDKKTLEKIRDIYIDILRYCKPNIPGVLVGNKMDCVNEISVTKEDALETASSLNIGYITVSAKTKKNVDNVFTLLIEEIMNERNGAINIQRKRAINVQKTVILNRENDCC
jgi:Ras-related protein Rab-1A